MRRATTLTLAMLVSSCADGAGSSTVDRNEVAEADARVADEPDDSPWVEEAGSSREAQDASVVAADAARAPSASDDPGDAAAGARADMDAARDASPMDATSLMDALARDAAPDALEASVEAGAGSMTDEALQTAVIAKLRSCLVVGEGTHYERPIEDGHDRCLAGCLLAADCSAVVGVRCMGAPDPQLSGCNAACSLLPTDDGFACGGLTLRRSWVCDQSEDCPAGEDEAACAPFTCDDGRSIASPHVHCDGHEDCADGSDERGCAPYCPIAP